MRSPGRIRILAELKLELAHQEEHPQSSGAGAVAEGSAVVPWSRELTRSGVVFLDQTLSPSTAILGRSAVGF